MVFPVPEGISNSPCPYWHEWSEQAEIGADTLASRIFFSSSM